MNANSAPSKPSSQHALDRGVDSVRARRRRTRPWCRTGKLRSRASHLLANTGGHIDGVGVLALDDVDERSWLAVGRLPIASGPGPYVTLATSESLMSLIFPEDVLIESRRPRRSDPSPTAADDIEPPLELDCSTRRLRRHERGLQLGDHALQLRHLRREHRDRHVGGLDRAARLVGALLRGLLVVVGGQRGVGLVEHRLGRCRTLRVAELGRPARC